MEVQDTLVQLLQITERLSTKVDQLDKRMSKIESVVNNDIRQDQRLDQIELSLKRGNEKFRELEDRLDTLEGIEGERAKKVMAKVVGYIGTTMLGFIGAAIMFYIKGGN